MVIPHTKEILVIDPANGREPDAESWFPLGSIAHNEK